MEKNETIEGLGARTDSVCLRPGLEITELQVSAEEGLLLSRISPGESIDSLLAVCGLPESRAIALIIGLVVRGILEGPTDVSDDVDPMASFAFDATLLAEAVELDEAIKKELLYREAMGNRWHHYDVLGVRPKTPAGEIQKAYIALVRRLHPDRFFGKALGSYQARIERVVQRIRDAYETLSDARAKALYDRNTEIPPTREEQADLEDAQERKLRDERRKLERRERLRKRAPIADRKRKATEFAAEARKAASKEDWRQASNLYRLGLTYDPGNATIEALLEEAEALAASARSEDLLSRARSADALGNPQQAETFMREAVEVDNANPQVLLALLRFLLARGEKADTLVGMAKKVTYLDRHSVEGWILYGNLLMACGEKDRARRAYEQAVDLDETADEAKEALKKMRWTLF